MFSLPAHEEKPAKHKGTPSSTKKLPANATPTSAKSKKGSRTSKCAKVDNDEDDEATRTWLHEEWDAMLKEILDRNTNNFECAQEKFVNEKWWDEVSRV